MKTKTHTTWPFPIAFAMIIGVAGSLISEHSHGEAATKKAEKRAATKTSAGKNIDKSKVVKPSPKVEYNSIGLKAFQKGDFKSALKNFEQSMKTDPKNALGFLNHARALVAINVKVDPEDYCSYHKNWVYLALSSLSRAIDLNRKQVGVKLKEAKERSFLEFKKRPEFRKWESTLKLPLISDQEVKSFIFSHPEWLTREAAMVPTVVTLRSDFTVNVLKPDGQNSEGKWRAEKSKVIVDSKLLAKTLTLKVIPFFFNEGKNYLHATVLVDGSGVELYVGPITEDCS